MCHLNQYKQDKKASVVLQEASGDSDKVFYRVF